VLTKAGALAVAVASASPRAGLLAVRIDDHAAAVANGHQLIHPSRYGICSTT